MNYRYHTIILSTDGSEDSGIVIVPGAILAVGNNEQFIIAQQCGIDEEENDTSYYIVDIRKYKHKNWFQRKILVDNFHEYTTYIYPDTIKFIKALDSLQIRSQVKLTPIMNSDE